MNCLIIAAGHGSRLRSLSPSKPLTPVNGVPLIEHVVRAARAGGATAFHVVTGHAAERVESFLADLSTRLGVAIRAVRTEDWNRPNGHSVVTGAETIDGDYLLLMTDHLFDPGIVRALLDAPRAEGVRLAVDRDLASPFLDLDDATKVETAPDGAILSIGKALERYDAIDTGLFRATPALAAAIRASIEAGGGGNLSEGVQGLAAQGLAWTIEVAGRRWIDVDDPRSLALAETLAESLAALRDNAA